MGDKAPQGPHVSDVSIDVLNQILQQFRIIGESLTAVVERTARLEQRTQGIEQTLLERAAQTRHWQMLAGIVVGGLILYLLQHLHWR